MRSRPRGTMTACEHQESECDCQKCDSFTCFEKRQKPGSCDCPVCKNSRTCLFYPHEIKETKVNRTCDIANKGCNTVDVWQKSDKYHLGRDVVCSSCDAAKQAKPKRADETCEGDSLKSSDKLCSQCEFKRNVLGSLNKGCAITGDGSLESSKDQVLCKKHELNNNSVDNKDNAETNAEPNAGHTCQLFGTKNGSADTPPKTDSRMCNKCQMKEESTQKFKKYSFDEGKVYEFPDDNKNVTCELKEQSVPKFRKFSFDEGKIYEFPDDDKSKGCPKCQMKEHISKFRKLSFEEGKIYEFLDDKNEMCPKCQQNEESAQKLKKYSFDDGKVYVFIDEDKNKCKMKVESAQKFRKCSFDDGKIYELPGQKRMCSQCQKIKNVLERFKKSSFDNGKVYEFDEDKNCNDKLCPKCQLLKASEDKEKNLCDHHAGKEAEPPKLCAFHAGLQTKSKKVCSPDCAKKPEPENLCAFHARKDSEPKKDLEPPNLCKFHAKKAEKVCAFDCDMDPEPKNACALHARRDEESKNVCALHAGKEKTKDKIKKCASCGRNKPAEPISMKIIYKDKCGNDIFCNKIIKTTTKIEKDKVYKFKDEKGVKVEKKVSSREFKKSTERHFGKAIQVNNLISPHKNNKDTRRHLSDQLMNVSSVKVLPPKPCAKSASATQTSKAQPGIPKFDVFKRIKQIYDACSCKECRCIGSDVSSCNSHSIKGKTASKFAQNLQFWEGFRAALNSLLHGKPTCEDGKSKNCSCNICQCIKCDIVTKSQPKQNTVVVAAAGENPASSNCSCAPCDCMHCRTTVVSMSSNATHEISTGRSRHQNCHCQSCLNEDCVPDEQSDLCKCNKRTMKKPAPTGDTTYYDVRQAQVVYDKFHPRRINDTVVMYVKVPKTYPFQKITSRPSSIKESECSCKTENIIELKDGSDSYCSCVACICEACKDADNTTEIVQIDGNRCDCVDCDCEACRGLDMDTNDFCPLKLRRLQINAKECGCDYCQKMLNKPIPGYDKLMRKEREVYLRRSPSQTETLTSKSTKSTNCQFLGESSSLISMYLPTTDQDNSQPSYEISSDDYLKSDESQDKYYKQSFYKEIFGPDFHIAAVTNNSKKCEDIAIGDGLTVTPKNGSSTATVIQPLKEESKVTENKISENITIKSIVRSLKSFTNAEKLLNVARGFSADLLQILQKYEEANRVLSEKSHHYMTSILEEKKDQLFSKVNNYSFLSIGNKEKSATKVREEKEDGDVWVIDGYCSKDGNIVYIPMRNCNDDDSLNENQDNYLMKSIAQLSREPTRVNFFTTQETVHLNLRFRETAKSKALTRKITSTDIIQNPGFESSILQSGALKSKATKLDLEWKGVNDPFMPSKPNVNNVNSNSLESYTNCRGDPNIKVLENNVSFCNDLKVDGIEVQRVSTCSIIIKWNSPKVDENVLGYELLVDGRPTQKILNPSRCVALVSSLPKTDKVLLTVKTILLTPMKYYPTMNSVYYPVRSSDLGNWR